MHINVKPVERSRIYETPQQAIGHLFHFGVFASKWDADGKSFGQTIEAQRRINEAVKARNYEAFKALKRRGYWRIELA